MGVVSLGMVEDTDTAEQMDTDSSPADRPDSLTEGGGNMSIECFEDGCDTETLVAIWEDNTLAGKYLPVCPDCSGETPEYNLWNAAAIEEHSDTAAPDERTEHPIPEDEEWAVVDSSPQSVEEFLNRYPNLNEEMYLPEEQAIEIFLRDPSDTEALEQARARARELSNEYDE